MYILTMSFSSFAKAGLQSKANTIALVSVLSLMALVFASLSMASNRVKQVDSATAEALVAAGYGTSVTVEEADGTSTTTFKPNNNGSSVAFVVLALVFFVWGGMSVVAAVL